MRDKRGFTLLELLVVLAIVGIISALLAPRMIGSMSNVNLKTATKNIAAGLRYARSQATWERIPYRAVFDFEKNLVTIKAVEEDTEKDPQDHPADDKDGEIPSKSYPLPEGVKLRAAVSGDEIVDTQTFEILFFPSGGTSGGEVFLQNDRGKRTHIRVDFITGIVQIGDAET